MKLRYLIYSSPVIIMFGIIAIFYNLVVTIDEVNEVQEKRYKANYLSTEVQLTSIDLTKLARKYVITGKKEYRDQYNSLLSWSKGKSKRPVTVYYEKGTTKDHLKMISELGFSKKEAEFLKNVVQRSRKLNQIEIEAMNSRVRKPNVAINLVFGKAYETKVSNVMSPLGAFWGELAKNSKANILRVESKVNYFVISLVLLFALLAASIVLCVY